MTICTAGCNVPAIGGVLCSCWVPVFECNPQGGACVPEIGCEGTCDPTWMLYALVVLVIFVFCVLPCIMFKFCCSGSGDAKRKVVVITASSGASAERMALLADGNRLV